MKQTDNTTSLWLENLTFDWTNYLQQAKVITLSKHQTLFAQEEPISQIYVVRKGRVRLAITNQLGEEKALMIIGKNGFVGDLGLYSTSYLTSSVTATNCELLSFSVADFRQLLCQHPELLQFFLVNLDKKFQVLSTQVVELSYRSAKARVLQLFLQLAATYGVEVTGRIRIGIRFTQQEMANVAGTSRVTVAQIFQLLKKQNIITKENGYIYVSSMQDLENLIDEAT